MAGLSGRRGAFGKTAVALSRFFPKRQILIREGGHIRCFTIGTGHQLAAVLVVGGCLLWAVLATGAYMHGSARLASKDDEIARKMAELNSLKDDYQTAFGRLDDFQAVFSDITCEIDTIQDGLVKVAERNAATGNHRGTPGPTLTVPAANGVDGGCPARTSGGQAFGQMAPSPAEADSGDTKRIVGALQDPINQSEKIRRRLAMLEEGLKRLKASHDVFLQNSANLAAFRVHQLERTLASVGVDADSLANRKSMAQGGPYGRGGPFIALPAHGAPAPGSERSALELASAIAVFNSHADRLDNLTVALKSLPLGEPLTEYEVTSPFGARNDPINALTGIHEGVDLGAPTGTPVLATGEGHVVWAGWRDRYGLMVEIDHGMSLHTRYAHLSKLLVNLGAQVGRGTPIGLVGETGRTTGPHLHYEVRVGDQATNPMKFITAGRDVLKGQ